MTQENAKKVSQIVNDCGSVFKLGILGQNLKTILLTYFCQCHVHFLSHV